MCPPADLASCSRLLSRPSNRVYERYFMRRLLAAVAERHRLFPDLAPVPCRRACRCISSTTRTRRRSAALTAPTTTTAGSSAAPLVPGITLPCRILFGGDDPFIDGSVFDGVTLPANVQVLRTPAGGHVGFLGRPGRPGGFYWLDAALLGWIGTG